MDPWPRKRKRKRKREDEEEEETHYSNSRSYRNIKRLALEILHDTHEFDLSLDATRLLHTQAFQHLTNIFQVAQKLTKYTQGKRVFVRTMQEAANIVEIQRVHFCQQTHIIEMYKIRFELLPLVLPLPPLIDLVVEYVCVLEDVFPPNKIVEYVECDEDTESD